MVTAAELPAFLSSDNLRWMLLGAIVVLVLIAIWVANFVRHMTTRVVVLAVVGLLAVLLWAQRAELGDCQDTCSCRLLGQDVQVPDSARFGCDG